MLLARWDEYGKATWLELAILAFWAARRLGLAVFAFLVGSRLTLVGREEARRSPSCWTNLPGVNETGASWSSAAASRCSGYVAADTCRTVELKGLQVQEKEFRAFLNRLLLARNNEEFDRFVPEQRQTVTMGPAFGECGA